MVSVNEYVYRQGVETMEKFIIYDIDRHEKIAEAYTIFMCQDMIYAYFDYGIDNIQIQHIKNEEGEK